MNDEQRRKGLRDERSRASTQFQDGTFRNPSGADLRTQEWTGPPTAHSWALEATPRTLNIDAADGEEVEINKRAAESDLLVYVNINLVAFSVFQGNVVGQVFAMLVLTVAAAEAAIGLAILVVYFRNRGTIAVEDINAMKG